MVALLLQVFKSILSYISWVMTQYETLMLPHYVTILFLKIYILWHFQLVLLFGDILYHREYLLYPKPTCGHIQNVLKMSSNMMTMMMVIVMSSVWLSVLSSDNRIGSNGMPMLWEKLYMYMWGGRGSEGCGKSERGRSRSIQWQENLIKSKFGLRPNI